MKKYLNIIKEMGLADKIHTIVFIFGGLLLIVLGIYININDWNLIELLIPIAGIICLVISFLEIKYQLIKDKT